VGRSLLPLIRGENVAWRTDFLLEHSYGTEKGFRAPDYCGLRSTDWKYVLYMLGAEELYNLRTDPYEMVNLADEPSAQDQRMAMRSKVMEKCDPLPPRFPG